MVINLFIFLGRFFKYFYLDIVLVIDVRLGVEWYVLYLDRKS